MEIVGASLERRLLLPLVALVSFALFNAVRHLYDWGVVLLIPVCLFVLGVAIDIVRDQI